MPHSTAGLIRRRLLLQTSSFETFKKQISEYLSQEIITRYFYQRGAAMERLKDDDDLESAVKVLQNKAEYAKILSVSK